MSRAICKSVEVPASAEEVWQAWTTVPGVRGFFAPEARIECREGGAYELYFMPEAPAGSRGSDGCTILELEAPRRLVFSWNFPPMIPTIRDEHTTVAIEIEPGDEGCRVAMTQSGWGEGDDWDEGFAYFDRAWELVLRRLRHRFVEGPVDWNDPCC